MIGARKVCLAHKAFHYLARNHTIIATAITLTSTLAIVYPCALIQLSSGGVLNNSAGS